MYKLQTAVCTCTVKHLYYSSINMYTCIKVCVVSFIVKGKRMIRSLLTTQLLSCVLYVTFSKKKSEIKESGIKSSNPVLRMSGCTLYSFAKTKGTIP